LLTFNPFKIKKLLIIMQLNRSDYLASVEKKVEKVGAVKIRRITIHRINDSLNFRFIQPLFLPNSR